MNKYKVAIVGLGPSGLAALRVLNNLAGIEPIIIEAGQSLEDRLTTVGSNPENVVNGMGGAGLYSDRKLSTFPAGSGQLLTNPYELRESYARILGELQSVLPHLNFGELLKKTTEFLGDEKMSSEILDQKLEKEMSSFDFIKLYPSLVLSDFQDAVSILESYQKNVSKATSGYFGCKVTNIRKTDNNQFLLDIESAVKSTASYTDVEVDYVILAMGRFGCLSARKFEIFQSHPSDFEIRRLEFGVRVDVNSHEPLRKALLKLTKDSVVNDPKLKIKRTFIIGGRPIECEFRTFCVCLPSDSKKKEGYVAKSRDIVTGIESYSGSSSYEELMERKKLSHVTAGSNLGIMMRIVDPEIVRKYYVRSVTSSEVPNSQFSFNVDDMDDNITILSQHFPKELCYPLFTGILEIIHTYSGESVRGEIKMHAPCIEGTGYYLRVDPRTYQHANNDHIFITGDMVGHTRGLLQGLTMGDIAAKSLITHMTDNYMKKCGVLESYQSLFMPSFQYNKTLLNNGTLAENCTDTLKQFQLYFKNFEDFNVEFYNEILENMFRPTYDGELDNMGVLYELHHFFLDNSRDQLHFISQKAAIQYILLCNTIESCKEFLVDRISDLLKDDTVFKKWSKRGNFVNNIRKTFMVHQFKSCILALRTRKDIESRDRYTDIPVMQSAYKIAPISKLYYKSATVEEAFELHNLETKIVAMACTLLNDFFTGAISKFNLSLNMVRNKIETQEPSVGSLVLGRDPLYLECHVKVSISQSDGTPAEYYAKKRIIQSLASLFEGPNAVVRDIFNVMSVSINLLKHPQHGQQFFLTYRTDTKKEMQFIRKNFSKIMRNALEMVPRDSELRNYKFNFYTDAEFVIYDDNRGLDLPWFPITTEFLDPEYEINTMNLITSKKKMFVVTSNTDKLKEIKSAFRDRYGNDIYISQYYPQELLSSEIDLSLSAHSKLESVIPNLSLPALAESTGLIIDGTKGFPGAQTELFLNHVGDEGLLKLASGQNVHASTAISFYDGFKYHSYTSRIHGGKLVRLKEVEGQSNERIRRYSVGVSQIKFWEGDASLPAHVGGPTELIGMSLVQFIVPDVDAVRSAVLDRGGKIHMLSLE